MSGSIITNAAFAQRDLAVLWHPCTQMRDHEALPPIPVAHAEGAWLTDFDGNRYLDAVGSWWVNLFGHRHPRIVDGIRAQLDTLDHVLLAGFSHEPAVRLAEELVAITPPGLERVFYADNGSSAIEVALKMSLHCWRNRGESRTRFVALTGGYHGETLGALSITDLGLYREPYRPLLVEPLWAPSPDAFLADPGESAEAFAQRRLLDMRELLERHTGEVSAVILEPLVQCAGGMRLHHPSYLSGLRSLCDEFRVHLIADEIAVGFGRTGTLFACEQAGIQPDLLCLSKGLTGGFLPLCAVLATQAIYDGFLDDSRERAFLHSHSYSGNPLACAAALASLDILEGDGVLARNRATAAKMAALAAPFRAHPTVAEVRQAGMVVAIELHPDTGNDEDGHAVEIAGRRGLRMYRAALEAGVLLRPLGDVLYWMPPYCIDDAQLELLANATRRALEEA